MLLLHPFFAYPTLILALFVFGLQMALIVKSRSVPRYGVYLNGLLVIFALLSVVFGFDVSNIPLVQSKAPFIWTFPHKWVGILLFLLSLLSFIVFWFKGEGVSRKMVLLPSIGLLLTLFQLFTGWMLRLVFFS